MIKAVAVVGVAILMVAAAGLMLMRADILGQPRDQPVAAQPPLPGVFGRVKLGMTQPEIIDTVGKPLDRWVNPHYQRKTPAQWAELQARVDAESRAPGGAYAAAPSIEAIRDGAELTHRYHDVWAYRPIPAEFVMFYFGDTGALIKVAVAPAPKKGTPSQSPR